MKHTLLLVALMGAVSGLVASGATVDKLAAKDSQFDKFPTTTFQSNFTTVAQTSGNKYTFHHCEKRTKSINGQDRTYFYFYTGGNNTPWVTNSSVPSTNQHIVKITSEVLAGTFEVWGHYVKYESYNDMNEHPVGEKLGELSTTNSELSIDNTLYDYIYVMASPNSSTADNKLADINFTWGGGNTSGVENVEAETDGTPERYYNLLGQPVDRATAPAGLYVTSRGRKVLVRR